MMERIRNARRTRSVLALALVCFYMSGCSLFSNEPDPDRSEVRKLDPQGNTWYIYADYQRTHPGEYGDPYNPADLVEHTCATIGREVERVELANEYATEATVQCGDPLTTTTPEESYP